MASDVSCSTSQSHIFTTSLHSHTYHRHPVSCFLHVSGAFLLTNCCDSWPPGARRRKCRVGAVQASDSYVSELVTCYPSCLTWLISDRSGRHCEVWVGWAAEFMSRSSVSTSRMVDWVDECYVYGCV